MWPKIMQLGVKLGPRLTDLRFVYLTTAPRVRPLAFISHGNRGGLVSFVLGQPQGKL